MMDRSATPPPTPPSATYANLSPCPAFRNLGPELLAGVIFTCTDDSFDDCLRAGFFGLPRNHFQYVQYVRPSMVLFLFNYSTRELHGIFRSVTPGKLDGKPSGVDSRWASNFPSQVCVDTSDRYPPLPESLFRMAIHDNYQSSNSTQFSFELDTEQVARISEIFKQYHAHLNNMAVSPSSWNALPTGLADSFSLQDTLNLGAMTGNVWDLLSPSQAAAAANANVWGMGDNSPYQGALGAMNQNWISGVGTPGVGTPTAVNAASLSPPLLGALEQHLAETRSATPTGSGIWQQTGLGFSGQESPHLASSYGGTGWAGSLPFEAAAQPMQALSARSSTGRTTPVWGQQSIWSVQASDPLAAQGGAGGQWPGDISGMDRRLSGTSVDSSGLNWIPQMADGAAENPAIVEGVARRRWGSLLGGNGNAAVDELAQLEIGNLDVANFAMGNEEEPGPGPVGEVNPATGLKDLKRAAFGSMDIAGSLLLDSVQQAAEAVSAAQTAFPGNGFGLASLGLGLGGAGDPLTPSSSVKPDSSPVAARAELLTLNPDLGGLVGEIIGDDTDQVGEASEPQLNPEVYFKGGGVKEGWIGEGAEGWDGPRVDGSDDAAVGGTNNNTDHIPDLPRIRTGRETVDAKKAGSGGHSAPANNMNGVGVINVDSGSGQGQGSAPPGMGNNWLKYVGKKEHSLGLFRNSPTAEGQWPASDAARPAAPPYAGPDAETSTVDTDGTVVIDKVGDKSGAAGGLEVLGVVNGSENGGMAKSNQQPTDADTIKHLRTELDRLRIDHKEVKAERDDLKVQLERSQMRLFLVKDKESHGKRDKISEILESSKGTTVQCPADGAEMKLGGAVVEDLYIVGGIGKDEVVAKLEYFRTDVEEWFDGPEFPMGLCYGAAVSFGPYIFVLGGVSTNKPYDQRPGMWNINLSTGTVCDAPPLMSPRAKLGAAELAGRIYTIGGRHGARAVRTVEIYDPLQDCWFPGPPLNDARYAFGTTVVDGALYVMGGIRDQSVMDTVEMMDPREGQWKRVGSLSHPRGALACAPVKGNILVVGGYCEGEVLNTAEILDVRVGCSHARPNMEQGRSYCSATTIDGTVYVVGGRVSVDDDDKTLADMERFSVEDTVWLGRLPAGKVGARAFHAACAVKRDAQ